MRAICLALVAMLIASAAHAKPWRHGIVAPSGDAGFAMMAEKGGFADRQGLELETVAYPTDAFALNALVQGEIDSYEGAPGAAILAAAKREDVRIVGCPWLGVTDSLFTHASIATPQDLRGQIVAAAPPPELPDLVAEAYLAANSVPRALVRFAAFASDEDRFAALQSGNAAAAVVSIEYLPLAERSDTRLAARGDELMPNFVRRCIMASERDLRARREDAIRFLASEMAALAHALQRRDEEIALARASAGMKRDDPRPAALFAEAARSNGVAPALPIPLDRLAAMEALLARHGALAREFDPRDMVDDDVRDEARDRLARN